jgi:hypothetical protein
MHAISPTRLFYLAARPMAAMPSGTLPTRDPLFAIRAA